MTTYVWKADDYTVGNSAGTLGFTRVSSLTNNNEAIVSLETPIGSLAWRISSTDTARHFGYGWTGTGSPGSIADGEVLILCRRQDNLPGTSANQRSGAGTMFRGGSASSNTYYTNRTGDASAPTQAWHYRFSTAVGCHTQTTNNSLTDQYDWYWVRTRFDGINTKTRFWSYGETEPAGWVIDCDDTDAGAFTTAGSVGIAGRYHYNADAGGSTSVWLAYLSVSDDLEEAAPMPDTGLAFTTAPTVTSRTTDSYTIGGTTNQDCTVFAVATETTATDPDGPQIAAGTDGDDAAAPGTGSVAATADTEFSLSITGTFTETTHDIHIVARREAE